MNVRQSSPQGCDFQKVIEELKMRRVALAQKINDIDSTIDVIMEIAGLEMSPKVPCAPGKENIPENIPENRRGLMDKRLRRAKAPAVDAPKGRRGPRKPRDAGARKKIRGLHTSQVVTSIPCSPGAAVHSSAQPGSKVSGHSTKKLLHYKGVKPLKPKEDGTPRFEGHTRVDGKFKYLGTFSVEELAAAAVMEAEGNKAEAERLQKIGECKEAQGVKKNAVESSKKKESLRKGRQGPRPFREDQKFKGVTPMTSKKDGSIRYRTTYWDPVKKSNYSCGTFGNVLEAAIAVARAIGDKAEVQRISDMIEQTENNPNRLPQRLANRQDDPPDKTPQVFECKNCFKQQFRNDLLCPDCGHTEFKPIV